jgi:hypothetical protein
MLNENKTACKKLWAVFVFLNKKYLQKEYNYDIVDLLLINSILVTGILLTKDFFKHLTEQIRT